MPLEIPKEHRATIGKIIALSDESVTQLIAAISAVKIRSTAKEMCDAIRDQTTLIDHDDLSAIIGTLYSLYHVREFSEVRTDRFISDILDWILKQERLGKQIEDDIPRVRKLFRSLLKIDTLNALTKAIKLQRAGERIFCDSRIITDIRPVFGNDISEGPASAVITHTLRLGFHSDGDGPHQSFYLTLDEADLHSLSDDIHRAIDKAEALTKKTLEQAQIARLGI
jgi:hypothetical protein